MAGVTASGHHQHNVDNYEVLRELPAEFTKQIVIVCVFGKYDTEVIIVTKDNHVFAFGANKNGCLGVGHDQPVFEPTRVEELCYRKVRKFSYGRHHVVALTKYGEVYVWGCNQDGQLGDGTLLNSNSPLLVEHFVDRRVIDISCGAFHTLALTKSGEIYSWGFNFWGQIGNRTNESQLTPYKVRIFDAEKFVAISCGFHHSLALTEDGHVYTWGYNFFGQLGFPNCERANHQNIPIRVDTMSGVKITKIICGSYHSLMLSSDGDVYTFGRNYYGQLGNGNKRDQNISLRINTATSNKFVDIAASHYSDISVALSKNGNCFIWGYCYGEEILVPRETPMKSIYDIFARYKIPFKAICFKEKKTVYKNIANFIYKMRKRVK